MKLLEERIRRDGEIKSGDILKVDRFLNHQMDPVLFRAMAEEWKRLYDGSEINKILTIEASGIGIACVAGLVFGVPVVFAKKSKSRNVSDDVYTAEVVSFTHGNTNTVQVSREYLHPEDRILIIDDFLPAARRSRDSSASWSSPARRSWARASPSKRPSSPAGRASAEAACAWSPLRASPAWTRSRSTIEKPGFRLQTNLSC